MGPDYRTPADAAVQRPDAQAPFLESHEAAYRQDAPPGRWWRLYDDPALDGLVEQALAANTDLRVAAANLERAQAATREAQAQQQPSVGVNASPTFGHVSGLQELQPGVDPQPLVLLGRRQRVVPAGPVRPDPPRGGSRKRRRAGRRAAYDATRVTVAAETARAYANMRRRHAAGVRPAFGRGADSLAGRRRAPATRRTRHRAGRDPRPRPLQQLQANLPPFQAQQRTALYRLAALTGRTPAQIPASCCNAPRRRA